MFSLCFAQMDRKLYVCTRSGCVLCWACAHSKQQRAPRFIFAHPRMWLISCSYISLITIYFLLFTIFCVFFNVLLHTYTILAAYIMLTKYYGYSYLLCLFHCRLLTYIFVLQNYLPCFIHVIVTYDRFTYLLSVFKTVCARLLCFLWNSDKKIKMWTN